MLKFFVHIAHNTENRLEKRIADAERRVISVGESAAEHYQFLEDTMVELQGRMARVKAVQKRAEQLTS